ncbi:aladin isoform X2 [Hydra vulgaris]|uniref:Aladin isoform X2 n=1 Tax=Hydra vulgaris TaxID=6087 RepID=A0ABM4CVG5_HYDVU
MATLSDFQPPSNLNPTVCERNSMLLNDLSYAPDYRRIELKNIYQKKNLACFETSQKQPFLFADKSLVETVRSAWESDGINGVLDAVYQINEAPVFAKNLVLTFQKCLQSFKIFKEQIFPVLKDQLVNNKSILACHPHIGRLAIVINDDTIKVLTTNKLDDSGILLKDKRITEITCLSWRPKSSLSIAVGSKKGILVWFLDPSNTVIRPGSNTTKLLYVDDMTAEVSSVSWCPDGKLLACSCKGFTSIWIWDVVIERSTSIQRVGNGISYLHWSHCGNKLFAADQSKMFRVWETKTWSCEKWGDLNGTCTNACWSSCGSFLLFTVANEPFIYYLHFYKNSTNKEDSVLGSGVALKCADLSSYCWSDECFKPRLGGLISHMAWDPTDSRLAVSFKGDASTDSPYIAIFHTKISPVLQLIPCGFVNGEVEETPLMFDFVRGYDKGALLSVYWSSETLSLIPFFYNSTLTLSPAIHFHAREEPSNQLTDNNANTTIFPRSDMSLYSVNDDTTF